MIIVLTSINAPTKCVKAFSAASSNKNVTIVVAGDRKSPAEYTLPGCHFIDLDAQRAMFPEFASNLPVDSYTRKNIGYLAAMKAGAKTIIDTDDDNAPLPRFWDDFDVKIRGHMISESGWVNVYRYFSDSLIWPRGFPLSEISRKETVPLRGRSGEFHCPVQQGLADDNPDVDAIYRLILPLPITFRPAEPVVLDRGSWCPFNSQNTRWWPEVFPLLYLPAYCSFRMTDIWRSFVVQRILWECDWHLSFSGSTVYQDRNEHNLMRDFEDEVPGYLNNQKIVGVLGDLNLLRGADNHGDNLRRCYTALVDLGVIDRKELLLLALWISAVESLRSSSSSS